MSFLINSIFSKYPTLRKRTSYNSSEDPTESLIYQEPTSQPRKTSKFKLYSSTFRIRSIFDKLWEVSQFYLFYDAEKRTTTSIHDRRAGKLWNGIYLTLKLIILVWIVSIGWILFCMLFGISPIPHQINTWMQHTGPFVAFTSKNAEESESKSDHPSIKFYSISPSPVVLDYESLHLYDERYKMNLMSCVSNVSCEYISRGIYSGIKESDIDYGLSTYVVPMWRINEIKTIQERAVKSLSCSCARYHGVCGGSWVSVSFEEGELDSNGNPLPSILHMINPNIVHTKGSDQPKLLKVKEMNPLFSKDSIYSGGKIVRRPEKLKLKYTTPDDQCNNELPKIIELYREKAFCVKSCLMVNENVNLFLNEPNVE